MRSPLTRPASAIARTATPVGLFAQRPPSTSPNIVGRDVLSEVGWRRRRAHRGVNGKLLVVSFETRMVGRLENVDALRLRMPRWNH